MIKAYVRRLVSQIDEERQHAIDSIITTSQPASFYSEKVGEIRGFEVAKRLIEEMNSRLEQSDNEA